MSRFYDAAQATILGLLILFMLTGWLLCTMTLFDRCPPVYLHAGITMVVATAATSYPAMKLMQYCELRVTKDELISG